MKPPEGLLAAGLDHCPEAVLGVDQATRLCYANPAACRLFGYEPSELLAAGLPAIQPDPGWDPWRAPALETVLTARDGTRVPVRMTRARLEQDGRKWLLFYVHDLTGQRATEAALRKSESRFALAFNASPDAINLTRLEDGAYLEISQGFENLTGWKREEVLGRTSQELGLWADPDGRARMVALLRGGEAFNDQLFRFRRKDGSIIKGMMSGRMLSLEGVPSLLTITRDVTAQVDAQEALASLTDLLTAITAHVPAFITLLDPDGRIRYLNRMAPGFRMEDVLGMDFLAGISEEIKPLARAALDQVLAGAEQATYAGWGWGPERELRWYHCIMGPMRKNGQVTGCVLIALDETERRDQDTRLKAMEEALRQSQKLESLGLLAGGIAHDFNNLLTAIMGNLNLGQMKLAETSPALPYLEAVENTVLKASELTRQMLAYSGKGRFVVKPQDLNALVTEMLHLLEVTVSRSARLKIDLGRELPAIDGDAAQLQQVIMNLVTNAAEALAGREGLVRVGTREETLDAGRIAREFPAQALEPGRYVVLEVEDTGPGMDPQVLARIFEPFFTTKVKGRGLGLSAIRGILQGHRAGLRIRSAPGEGSRFQIYFPASAQSAAAPPRDPPAGPAAFTGTVLLVDDEEVILQSMGTALETMGFQVVRAADGLDALEAFARCGPELRLVLMDLTMPRMDGATAFRRMQAERPEVPVILSSGYDRQALEGARPAAFVQKPYRLGELRKVLQEVLA